MKTLIFAVVAAGAPGIWTLANVSADGRESSILVTRPYLQYPTTSGCTVAVAVTRPDPSLRLKWSGGEVPFTFRKHPTEGVCLGTARIDGLEPGTRVDFEVAGEKGSFTTWKEDGSGFKCAIYGDFQSGLLLPNGKCPDWERDPFLCGARMFADMYEGEQCEFAVGTGDCADRGLYEEEVRPLILERNCGILGSKIPFFMALGNHDTKHPDNGFFFVHPPAVGFPEVRSYAFVRDNCLFVCLDDAEVGFDVDPPKPATLRWLESVLRSETARRAKFRFVFQHVPVFEEDFGNCNRFVADLYSECGVDCVFSGDHHGYERIERGGFRQVVNGCMGYFGHGRPGCGIDCNWYGDETIVGGHSSALTNRTWRFQKPGCPGVLGEPTPINRGLFPGYATLEVRGDTATYRQLLFNADGSREGVFDSFMMKAGVRPPKTRGMAFERYCFDKESGHLAYILTGEGGAVLELEQKGPKVLRYRRPDSRGRLVAAPLPTGASFDLLKGADDTVWKGEPLVDEKARTVGVIFTGRKGEAKIVFRLKSDNSVEVEATSVRR